MSDTRPLRDQVRGFYEGMELPAELEERLRAAVQGEASPGSREEPPRWGRRALRVAAAVLLVVGGLEFARRGPLGPGEEAAPCAVFARTVAIRACENLGTEFEATSFAELSRRMDRLGFHLVEPAELRGKGLEVIGGRYSAADDGLMAEVKLRHVGTEETCTLYVRRLEAPFEASTRGRFEIAGLKVRVWSEAGLLFGLAAPA